MIQTSQVEGTGYPCEKREPKNGTLIEKGSISI